MKLDPQVEAGLGPLVEWAKTQPDLGHIFERAEAGEITQEEALLEMTLAVQQNKALTEAFQAEAMKHLAPLRDQAPDTIEPDTPGILFDSGVGLPRLNPLFEAALAERAQLDGDMPELRTGPLPPGVRPAVPVETTARNPAAIGRMLDEASDRVQADVDQHRTHKAAQIEAIAGGDDKALALAAQHGELLLQQDGEPNLLAVAWGSAETDPKSYRRGEVPAPVKVETPTGSALAALTPQERRQAAYTFLSTTQGRLTAVAAIRELVVAHLGSLVEVAERDYDPKRKVPSEEIVAHYEWSVNLSGAGATQGAFSAIDTAARALAKGLTSELPKVKPTVWLEVTPVNTVDIRSVGWGARLVTRDG